MSAEEEKQHSTVPSESLV